MSQEITNKPCHVAVIGAGVAGLTCARTLQQAGIQTTVFDKGYRVGGRLSTRQRDGRQFDHGAQYFTARDPAFHAWTEALAADGVVAPWAYRGLDRSDSTQSEVHWVGVGRNRAIAEHLARDITVHTQTRVAPIDSDRRLFDHEGRALGSFDVVVVTAPLAQAAELLTAFPTLASRLRAASHAPCWALMVEYDAPVELSDGIRGDKDIAWAARDTSKPGRDTSRQMWVVHATPEWTAAHLELSKEDAAERLLALGASQIGLPKHALFYEAHRWLYAQVKTPVGVPCLVDSDARIVVAGDGLLGPRIECAWQSGRAAAHAVLGF